MANLHKNGINRISNPLCKYLIKISASNITFADKDEQVENIVKSGKMKNWQIT